MCPTRVVFSAQSSCLMHLMSSVLSPGSTGRVPAGLSILTWWPRNQQLFTTGVQSIAFSLSWKPLGNSSAAVWRISLLKNQDADKRYPASRQMLPAPRNCWAPNSARTGDTDMTFRWERPLLRAWIMPHKWYLLGSWEPLSSQGRVPQAIAVPGLEPALPVPLKARASSPCAVSAALNAAPLSADFLSVPPHPQLSLTQVDGWVG